MNSTALNRPFVVASWNVNSINARLSRLLSFLDRTQPDVLCLQELKCSAEKFPFADLQAHGYQAAIYGQKTYNGVAVLAKVMPETINLGFQDGGDEADARLISVRVAGMTIICAYVPNGQSVDSPKYIYKLEWLRRLRSYLDTHHFPTERLIVAGDFNVAPTALDVAHAEAWRGQILFSEPEIRALAHVCDFGLLDTLRLHHQEGGLYSWWDYRQLAFPQNNGLRIDFLWATEPLASRCQDAWIERDERKGDKPSDHAPCMAIFAL